MRVSRPFPLGRRSQARRPHPLRRAQPRRACRRFPSQARLWFWAVVVAVPALASFVLDDLSDEQQPLFRHWHSVWHVLALVSTAYAMAFVLAVQLVQVRRCGGWKMGECVCDA